MASNPPTQNSEQPTAPAAAPAPDAAAPNGTHPPPAPSGEVSGASNANAATPPMPESKLPTRKDASLKEFLTKMDDYAPIVRLLFILCL